MDTLQQSEEYAVYVTKLGWNVHTVSGTHVFIKRLPFFGGFAKMQRIGPLPEYQQVLQLLKLHKIHRVVIEAREDLNQEHFRNWVAQIQQHVAVETSPYIPTKTIRLDLTQNLETLFSQCSEAKRRAVRKAKKNAVAIVINNDIDTLIRVKNRAAGFLGFITTKGLRELYESFGPKKTACIIAYTEEEPIATVFLVFHKQMAYYWIAGATKKGKKLFAPTLAAWEAILYAKEHGALWFDWVGVWDERFPNQHTDWKGFTKFKEGFGGNEIYYPVHF